MMKRTHNIAQATSGTTLILFAVLAPILFSIVIMCLEFGIFFFKHQAVERAVFNITNSIKINPGSAAIKTTAQGSGLSVVSFTASGNYFCANAYDTLAGAQAGTCNSNSTFNTTKPATLPVGQDYYYVKTIAFVKVTPLTKIATNLIPNILVSNVFRVNTVNPLAADRVTVLSCNGNDKALQTDATGAFVCGVFKVPPVGTTLGFYASNYKNECVRPNPATGNCTCQAGTKATAFGGEPGPPGSGPYGNVINWWAHSADCTSSGQFKPDCGIRYYQCGRI